MSSSTTSEAWLAAAAHTSFANRIHHYPTVDSTNTLAIAAAQAGAPSYSVWVADEQTAGRGRGGHTWHSAAGDGLYTSILLRPRMAIPQALWLALAAALAVQSAVAELTGLQPDIRWPNDLLLGPRKFAGILVETAATPGPEPTLRYAVLGIGINVHHPAFPPELRTLATSLYLETNRHTRREDLLAALLHSLDRELNHLEHELAKTPTAAPLLDRLTQASTWVQGKPVRVGEPADPESYTGITAGLDPRGFLKVRADDGSTRIVLSGGVRPK
jgi:BirA family biotin operon repressor/biotin-[acetyl-CoA-carboxylase] ligase